jgi:hypothetical protein
VALGAGALFRRATAAELLRGAPSQMLNPNLPADLVFRLLQQNMLLTDKLKKSAQRRRALEMALQVEVMDKDEARLHLKSVKDVCTLLQETLQHKEAALVDLQRKLKHTDVAQVQVQVELQENLGHLSGPLPVKSGSLTASRDSPGQAPRGQYQLPGPSGRATHRGDI